jgi:hypothetical protein
VVPLPPELIDVEEYDNPPLLPVVTEELDPDIPEVPAPEREEELVPVV